jgi:hypothetical protein
MSDDEGNLLSSPAGASTRVAETHLLFGLRRSEAWSEATTPKRRLSVRSKRWADGLAVRYAALAHVFGIFTGMLSRHSAN